MFRKQMVVWAGICLALIGLQVIAEIYTHAYPGHDRQPLSYVMFGFMEAILAIFTISITIQSLRNYLVGLFIVICLLSLGVNWLLAGYLLISTSLPEWFNLCIYYIYESAHAGMTFAQVVILALIPTRWKIDGSRPDRKDGGDSGYHNGAGISG